MWQMLSLTQHVADVTNLTQHVAGVKNFNMWQMLVLFIYLVYNYFYLCFFYCYLYTYYYSIYILIIYFTRMVPLTWRTVLCHFILGTRMEETLSITMVASDQCCLAYLSNRDYTLHGISS